MTQEEVETTFANHPYWAYKQGLQDGMAYTWASFRREAAKDAMCKMIGMGRDDGYKYSPEEVARYAIVYADELIKQLREEQK